MELTINTSSKTITIHNSVSLKELNDFLSSKFTEQELNEYNVSAEEKSVTPFRITDPIHPFGGGITYTSSLKHPWVEANDRMLREAELSLLIHN